MLADIDLTLCQNHNLPYLESLIHCLIIPNMDMAANYVSLIFWVDGLQHSVLENISFDIPDKGPPELSGEEFETKRPEILKRKCSVEQGVFLFDGFAVVLKNIVSILNNEDQPDSEKSVALALLQTTLITTKEILPVCASLGSPLSIFTLLSGYLRVQEGCIPHTLPGSVGHPFALCCPSNLSYDRTPLGMATRHISDTLHCIVLGIRALCARCLDRPLASYICIISDTYILSRLRCITSINFTSLRLQNLKPDYRGRIER